MLPVWSDEFITKITYGICSTFLTEKCQIFNKKLFLITLPPNYFQNVLFLKSKTTNQKPNQAQIQNYLHVSIFIWSDIFLLHFPLSGSNHSTFTLKCFLLRSLCKSREKWVHFKHVDMLKLNTGYLESKGKDNNCSILHALWIRIEQLCRLMIKANFL